jgi:hypothetical protein
MTQPAIPQNPKCDESGMGRDESAALGTNRAQSGTNQRRKMPRPRAGPPRNTTGQSIVRCPAQREITSAASGSGQRARRRRKAMIWKESPVHGPSASIARLMSGSCAAYSRRDAVERGRSARS